MVNLRRNNVDGSPMCCLSFFPLLVMCVPTVMSWSQNDRAAVAPFAACRNAPTRQSVKLLSTEGANSTRFAWEEEASGANIDARLPTGDESEEKLRSPHPFDDPPVLLRCLLLGVATTGLAACWNALLVEFEWMQSWRYTWPCLGLIFSYEGYNSLASEFIPPPMLLPQGQSAPTFDPPLPLRQSRKTSNDDDEGMDDYLQAPDKGSINWGLDDHIVASTNLVSETVSTTGLASAAIALRPLDRPPAWLRAAATLAGLGLAIGGAADALLPVYVTGPNFVTSAGLAPDAAAFLACCQATALVQRVRVSARDAGYAIDGVRGDDLALSATQVLLISQLLVLGAGSFDEVATRIAAALF